ncbi:hypothetical protein ACJJIF_05325 [Microbulbifer sp. SSSA002]|uniref:hypothetical protein n=1 Tax=Microbulbifer sp. SSSA002 TaxID=3243376 RepID=UPI00403A277E
MLNISWLKMRGHGFSKNINRMAFLIKMEVFFAEHLGGEVGPGVSEKFVKHLEGLEVDISTLSEK